MKAETFEIIVNNKATTSAVVTQLSHISGVTQIVFSGRKITVKVVERAASGFQAQVEKSEVYKFITSVKRTGEKHEVNGKWVDGDKAPLQVYVTLTGVPQNQLRSVTSYLGKMPGCMQTSGNTKTGEVKAKFRLPKKRHITFKNILYGRFAASFKIKADADETEMGFFEAWWLNRKWSAYG
ncbi:MAG: hypothetical protein ACOZAO_01585 [Patescibacteria group bacterium]